MPVVRRTGASAFGKKMKLDLERFKARVTKTHQNLAKMIIRDLIVNSPQWSGELAMHWGIEFAGKSAPQAGTVDNPGWAARESVLPALFSPFQMGMEPAVSVAIAREFRKVPSITYKDTLVFINRMPYAQDVENGVGPNGRPIRVENQLSSYGGVAMVGYIDMKYSKLKGYKGAIAK